MEVKDGRTGEREGETEREKETEGIVNRGKEIN